MEEWRAVVGYEGLYEVSNTGKVRSVDRVDCRGWHRKGKYIHLGKHRCGYIVVNISKDKKRNNKFVHRLVAEAFVPNPEGKPEVNHIDEIKSNNNADNLMWCTRSENVNYGRRTEIATAHTDHKKIAQHPNSIALARARMKPVLQYDLDGNFVRRWEYTDQVREGGFDPNCVRSVCKGRGKTSRGYIWKYE